MQIMEILGCVFSVGFDPGVIGPEFRRIGLDAEIAVKGDLILCISWPGTVFVFGWLTAEGAKSQHQIGDLPVLFQILHTFGFRPKMADLLTEDRIYIYYDAGDLEFGAAVFAER